MAVKNKTRYAILGILSISPCSGYDIKKFCDKTISHFWNENFGHIYPMLNQLKKEKLIKQEEKDEQEKRKIYSITDKGRKEFCKWLIKPVEIQPPRSELLLKLSFGNYMPEEKLIDMIEEVKKRHIKKLEHYKKLEKTYDNKDNIKEKSYLSYLYSPLRYGIIASEATVKWCDETITNIKTRKGD